MRISVVIPAKDEQDNIEPLVKELASALGENKDYEIIYVDDGSTDNTCSKLRTLASVQYPQLKVLRHRQSVGQSTAIQTGIRHAQGRYIITLDADGQNDPADIPNMIDEAEKRKAHQHFCIAGYRKNRRDTAWKRFQSRIANKIRGLILSDQTPDTGCGLKLFPKATYQQLPYFDHMHRFLPALIKRMGGEIVVIEVNHRERHSGQSKYNMLGRLGVGIVDMLGVLWLQRRNRLADVVNDDD